MSRFIIMLGPPGAGKGTQAKIVAKNLDMVHISSGDIFRENLKNQTEMGKKAETYLNRGELVPDDVTIEMIRERLSRPDCGVGAILDGFPRTSVQAQALAELLSEIGGKVACVPYINVPEDVLVERLQGRLTCRESGHIFHMKNNPPKVPGICDIDGSELYTREDDMPETVKNRIQVYLRQTAPLLDHYRELGQLVEIDGTNPIEKVTEQLEVEIRSRL